MCRVWQEPMKVLLRINRRKRQTSRPNKARKTNVSDLRCGMSASVPKKKENENTFSLDTTLRSQRATHKHIPIDRRIHTHWYLNLWYKSRSFFAHKQIEHKSQSVEFIKAEGQNHNSSARQYTNAYDYEQPQCKEFDVPVRCCCCRCCSMVRWAFSVEVRLLLLRQMSAFS